MDGGCLVYDCSSRLSPNLWIMTLNLNLDLCLTINDSTLWILQYGFWILPYGLQILKLNCVCLAVIGHWKIDFSLSIMAYGLLFMVFGKWIMQSTLWILQYGFYILSFGLCILLFGLCIMLVAYELLLMVFGKWIVESTLWILQYEGEGGKWELANVSFWAIYFWWASLISKITVNVNYNIVIY